MLKKIIGKILTAVVITAVSVSMIMPMNALADSQIVVTIGADLNEEQKTAMFRYFGANELTSNVIYVNNQQEREHLSGYVPIEQIGTRTISCAMVKPTTSGGIHVKTANLNWVTSNMIAATLSTSGVANCEVIAAAPFEVSGTGALTGVMIAYEVASGQTLDPVKKQIATEEMVTTGNIANQVGQAQATDIVNDIKIQIIEGKVVDEQAVKEIVEDVVEEKTNGDFTQEYLDELNHLAVEIANQRYEYQQMEETLQRVEQNVSGNTQVQGGTTVVINNNNQDTTNISNNEEADKPAQTEKTTEAEKQTELPPDSILTQTDDNALGENVIIDATDKEAVPETEPVTEKTTEQQGIDISVTDEYNGTGSGTEEQSGQEEVQAVTEKTTENALPVEAQTAETVQSDTEQKETPVVQAETENPETEPQSTAEEVIETETPETVNPFDGIATVISDKNIAGRRFVCININKGKDSIGAVSGTVTITPEGEEAFVTDVSESNVKLLDIDEETKEENGWETGTGIFIEMEEPIKAKRNEILANLILVSADGNAQQAIESKATVDMTETADAEITDETEEKTTADIYREQGTVLANVYKNGMFGDVTFVQEKGEGLDIEPVSKDLEDGYKGIYSIRLDIAGLHQVVIRYYDTDMNETGTETMYIPVFQ